MKEKNYSDPNYLKILNEGRFDNSWIHVLVMFFLRINEFYESLLLLFSYS